MHVFTALWTPKVTLSLRWDESDYVTLSFFVPPIKSEEVKLNDHLISELGLPFVILAAAAAFHFNAAPWNWRWLLWRKELIVLSFHYSYLCATYNDSWISRWKLTSSKAFAIHVLSFPFIFDLNTNINISWVDQV